MKKNILMPVFLALVFTLSHSLTSIAKPVIMPMTGNIIKAATSCSEFYTYSDPSMGDGSLCGGFTEAGFGSIDGHEITGGYACTFDEAEFEASLTDPCLAGTTFSTYGSDMIYKCESETKIHYGTLVTSGSKFTVINNKPVISKLNGPCASGYEIENRWNPSDGSSNYGYSCQSTNDEYSDGVNEDVCTAAGAMLSAGGGGENCCVFLEE